MNINQHKFITEYLRHRSAYTAYCIAYQIQDETQYDSIMRAAQQLLDNPDVGGVIRSVMEGIRYEAEQEIRAELKTDVLTVQRKREILARIANGDMYVAQNYKGKDCTQCTQMVTPTINQMLKAIDLDNKMAGHYPGNSRQLTPYPPKGETNLDRRVPHKEHKTQQNTTKNRNASLLAKEGTLESASRHEPTGEVEFSRRTQNTNNLQQNTTIQEEEKAPVPPLRGTRQLGGDIGEMPPASEPIGVVECSRKTTT